MTEFEDIENQNIVLELLKLVLEEQAFDKIKFEILKKKNKICIPNMEILKYYREFINEGKLPEDRNLFTLLRKQRARSISGISAITILMKPFPCPGKCVYCPTEVRMPKSYLSDEPAVMRAVLNKWDPKKQVETRINALHLMGHPVDKCEMIILGGTFSSYPDKYIRQYILDMYEQLNLESSENLEVAEMKNETAKHRCVGLSIETRPDHIDEDEILRLRELGVTKVELGVQTLYDDVLDLIKRGHKVSEVGRATKLLKDAGFKIHYHMMPNLPGSTVERDKEMFKTLFADSDYKPDMLKVYPCVVTLHSELEEWEKQGKFKTYTDETVIELLIDLKQYVPEYCRIMRLGRDIPANDITHGNQITNIREVVQERMKKKGLRCLCQRCREVGFNDQEIKNIVLHRIDYDANAGKEIYLEYREPVHNILLAFLRLRIPSQYYSKEKHFLPVLNNSALIREVHTYGFALEISAKSNDSTQHQGLGKALIQEAEKIASEEFGLNKIVVISGVGVRGYYRKLGYELEETYMSKKLK